MAIIMNENDPIVLKIVVMILFFSIDQIPVLVWSIRINCSGRFETYEIARSGMRFILTDRLDSRIVKHFLVDR